MLAANVQTTLVQNKRVENNQQAIIVIIIFYGLWLEI